MQWNFLQRLLLRLNTTHFTLCTLGADVIIVSFMVFGLSSWNWFYLIHSKRLCRWIKRQTCNWQLARLLRWRLKLLNFLLLSPLIIYFRSVLLVWLFVFLMRRLLVWIYLFLDPFLVFGVDLFLNRLFNTFHSPFRLGALLLGTFSDRG